MTIWPGLEFNIFLVVVLGVSRETESVGFMCVPVYSYIYKEIYCSHDYGSQQVPRSAGSVSKLKTQKNQ